MPQWLEYMKSVQKVYSLQVLKSFYLQNTAVIGLRCCVLTAFVFVVVCYVLLSGEAEEYKIEFMTEA